jgi:hypothetical protein
MSPTMMEPDQRTPDPTPHPTWSSVNQTAPDAGPRFETASTEPVKSTVRARRSRLPRLRWLVAVLAIVVVGAGSFAGYRLLAASAPVALPDLSTYAPATSLAYFEFHLNGPADQRQQLDQFLAHFPGFADGTPFETRLSNELDSVLEPVTGETRAYSAGIAPWFDGDVAFALTQMPSVAMTPAAGLLDSGATGTGVYLIGTKDGASARAWLEQRFATSAGATGAASGAGAASPNATVTTTGDAEVFTPANQGSSAVSIAALPNVIALGDAKSIAAVIQLNGKGGLADAAGFVAAKPTMAGSNLASYYVNMRRYFDWAMQTMSSLPSASGSAGSSATEASCALAAGAVPDWIGGTFSVTSDALVTHAATNHPAGETTANAAPALLAHLPASTLALVDEPAFGAALQKSFAQVEQCAGPGQADAYRQLDAAVTKAGGWDALTGWIGETAVVLDRDGANPIGGLLIAPKDHAAAENVLSLIKSNARSAGLVIHNSTYDGVTVSIATIGDGEPASTFDVAFSLTNDVLAVGSASWVKRVLDAPSKGTLAGDGRFSDALGRVDAANTSLVYADLAGLQSWLKSALPASEADAYAKSAEPYLEPFDMFIETSTVGTDLDSVDAAVTVR